MEGQQLPLQDRKREVGRHGRCGQGEAWLGPTRSLSRVFSKTCCHRKISYSMTPHIWGCGFIMGWSLPKFAAFGVLKIDFLLLGFYY